MTTPEDEIRSLIHSSAPPQVRAGWTAEWMTKNGLGGESIPVAVRAILTGVKSQEVSNYVWDEYRKFWDLELRKQARNV